jgi:hypothetical protein
MAGNEKEVAEYVAELAQELESLCLCKGWEALAALLANAALEASKLSLEEDPPVFGTRH